MSWSVMPGVSVREIICSNFKSGIKKPSGFIEEVYCKDLLQTFPCFYWGVPLYPQTKTNLKMLGANPFRLVLRLLIISKLQKSIFFDALLVKNYMCVVVLDFFSPMVFSHYKNTKWPRTREWTDLKPTKIISLQHSQIVLLI